MTMFVHNSTRFEPVLSRGTLTDALTVGAIVVEAQVDLLGRERLRPAPAAGPQDPPAHHVRRPLWRGTSVTILGDVTAPPGPPYVRRVDIRIGGRTRSVVVFGERRWRSEGERATDPARFDVVSLDASRAFGGFYQVPPGPEPGTGRPHPGGRVEYPLNPGGTGFYPDATRSRGKSLPQIEWLDDRVRSWRDRPAPAVLAPCPDLPGLRVWGDASHRTGENPYAMALQLQHHAAAPLIFEGVAPGVAIGVFGMRRAVDLVLPAGPVLVTMGPQRKAAPLAERIRSVHLDTRRQTARVTYEYAFQRRLGEAAVTVRVSDKQEGDP
jgi:hypothetical protein